MTKRSQFMSVIISGLLLMGYLGSIPQVRADPAVLTSFDQICVFTPSSTHLEISMVLQQNWAYLFSYEPYVVNVQYSINIHLTSPTSLVYHICDDSEDSGVNYQAYNISYIAAETGVYTVDFDVVPNANFNIYLAVHPFESLSQYYAGMWNDANAYVPTTALYYYNTTLIYNNAQTTHTISLQFQNNTEYWFDCFRTNPLPIADVEAQSYTFPCLTMDLSVNLMPYIIYNALPSLSVLTTNSSFRVRFGSAVAGPVIVTLSIDQSIFTVNFAFICYSQKVVGLGNSTEPANQTATNTTISNPLTNSSLFNPTLPNGTSFFDSIGASITNFCNENFDSILLVGSILVVGLLVSNYWYSRKHPEKADKDAQKQAVPKPDERTLPDEVN